MKAVLCSDAHVDHVTMGVSRFDEVERAFGTVFRAAVEEQADVVIFEGDLCDPADGPAVLRATNLLLRTGARLARERIHFVAIAGNHDVVENGSGVTTLYPLRAVDSRYVHVFEEPGVVTLDLGSRKPLYVVAMPFTATSHAYDPEEFIRKVMQMTLDTPTLIVSHLMIPGVQPGEETKEVPRGREVIYPFEAVRDFCASTPKDVFVSNGHYHRQQAFKPPGMGYTIHVPGAMARLTMGEERHEPGYLVVEL